SAEWVVVVKPLGPHHDEICAGSVQAWNTNSRGASNTRVITISAALPAALLADILLLLLFEILQILVQPVEALLPPPPVMIHPLGDFLERRRLQPAGPPLRVPPPRNQPSPLEHFQVLGHRRQAHVERRRQIRNRSLPG